MMGKSKKKLVFTWLLLFCAILMMAVPAQAAGRYRSKWRTRSGKIYYYNAKGKKETGLTKIGKKYYYFDSKGVQRFGWKKIGSNYYYFNPGRGKNASMVKSRTINGIRLDKNGRAPKNSTSLRKMKLMVEANSTVEKITTPLMPKSQKLKICFEYVKKTYGYCTWRAFSPRAGWELDYGEDMLYRGRGNCFSYASAFAFLANAVGLKNVSVVSSGGHGWAEIGGKVYDPDWALVSKVDSYYAMPYSLSGIAGRPLYSRNRAYVAKI